ncbi:MAG: hypothetical protein M1823_004099 [Watsoniomyces obsoletus]|nr:MAG: hypothetical protein M1823_004099 [Watsoniomyces obsoletus]
MQEIRSRGRLPILVGGTHYYIQSLLFKDVEGSEKDSSFNPEKSEGNMTREELESRFPILKASTEEMLARLKEVDPVMASRWHPHDRRRLQRSLEIYLLTGRRASDLYNAQRNGHSKEPDSTKIPKTETSTPDKNEDEDMASQLLGVPRGQTVNAPSLILWIHVPQSTLNARLDKRVERMVQDGLLSEVESLDEYLQMKESKGKSIKRDTGIWVSIGFKEFASYLSACKTHKNNTNEDGSTESLESLKQTAIERIQIATRQYAKRQIRWIRIKLLHALAATNMTNHLFVLDGSDTTQWTQNVVGPSEEIVEKYLAGTPLPKPAEIYPDAEQLLHPKSEVDLSLSPEKWIRRECELCGTTTVTEEDWSRHVNSKGHKKVVKSRRKKQERDAAIEQPRDAEQSDELGKIE